MTGPEPIKILLAYDGSDLALESVRYIGEAFPRDRTQVVIFYVETKIPRSFWRMEKELDFRFQSPQIRAAMAERKKKINLAMEKARQILLDTGFPSQAIHPRVHIKNQGIVQDIVEESHQGYDALVMGRKGHSRIKDFLVSGPGQAITGLFILDQKETPGLGNRILEKPWQDQFVDKPSSTPLVVVKAGKEKGHEIDGISGATISYRTVTTIVNTIIADIRPWLILGRGPSVQPCFEKGVFQHPQGFPPSECQL